MNGFVLFLGLACALGVAFWQSPLTRTPPIVVQRGEHRDVQSDVLRDCQDRQRSAKEQLRESMTESRDTFSKSRAWRSITSIEAA